MPRADYRIEKGQELGEAISAKAWNRAQDAADLVLRATPNVTGAGFAVSPKAPTVVLVRNDSGRDVPRLGVLEFTGAAVSPDQYNEDAFIDKQVLAGGVPQATGKAIGVTVEPIKKGEIGRVAIGGVFACKVKVLSTGHQYARPRYDDVTQLISAGCGPIRLAWVQGTGNDQYGIAIA